MIEMTNTHDRREGENSGSRVGVGVDPETAYGQASAGEQRNSPLSLLVGYYEPHELTGEDSEETIENLLDILDMKIETLSDRGLPDEHLDTLRRRRSALEDVRDSPVTSYDRELSWSEVWELAFSDR